MGNLAIVPTCPLEGKEILADPPCEGNSGY